jgi:small subunit ribosomal protein S3
MGQKVRPNAIRVGFLANFPYRSSWFEKKSGQYSLSLYNDYLIREHLKKSLKSFLVSNIEIQRHSSKLKVTIHSGRVGQLVGRNGSNLESIVSSLKKAVNIKDLSLDVCEVANVDTDPQIIADLVAMQLEKRMPFRRAIKSVVQKAQKSSHLKGIKIKVSGRLNGADIARTEQVKEGSIPLHTIRANIRHATSEALTVFGIIGVQVWVNFGENDQTLTEISSSQPADHRKRRKDR